MNSNLPITERPQAAIQPETPETSSEHADAPVAPVEAPTAFADLAIEYVPIDDIHEYPDNPRKNEDAVEKVAASIKVHGMSAPISLDRDNVIIYGHTRYRACRLLGMETVPCIIRTDLTPELVKSLRLADNKLAELSGWDRELLEKELAELAASGLNMEQFGFLDTMSDEEVDSFFTGIPPEPKETKKQTVTCPHCGKTFEIDVP